MSHQLNEKYYRASTRPTWEGRRDGTSPERFHEIIHIIDLKDGVPTPNTPAWGILGFACDEGVKRNYGRVGAAQGPEAFRKAFANFPLKSLSQTFYDLGDVICSNGDLEEAQFTLASIVTNLLQKNIRPLIIGGGHEVAWANYQGISAAYPMNDCAVINFDAHLDLRPLIDKHKGSSGTSFQQIASARLAQRMDFNCCYLGIQPFGNTQTLEDKATALNARIVLADEFHEAGAEASVEVVKDIVKSVDRIYVSICLDVFASPFAPGVSAPQPLGLFPWHVIPALKHLAASGKVVSFDIAELCPPCDLDGTTAKLAASLASVFIHSSLQEKENL